MPNKDVILQITIAALFCVLLFPRTMYSQSDKRIEGETEKSHANSYVTYDSYENYIPARQGSSIGTKELKKKTVPEKKKRPLQSEKQKPDSRKKSNRYIFYTVRKGDTLTAISKKHGVNVAALRSLNKLSNQNRITKGMIVKIPQKQTSSIPTGKSTFPSRHLTARQNNLRFQWPIKSVIDCRNDGLNGVKSIGIIITGKPGSTVLSSASGTVRKIGRMRGFGNYIVITHSGRYSTVYSNLDVILVSLGDTVPAGNAIGKIGSTEKKIHFQIDREGKPEDPLQYLPKKS